MKFKTCLLLISLQCEFQFYWRDWELEQIWNFEWRVQEYTHSQLTKAEADAMIDKAYDKEFLEKKPAFKDVLKEMLTEG